MYHPLYHLVRRVDNDSVICVTGVAEVMTSFLTSFLTSFENRDDRYCTCGENLTSFDQFDQL